VGHFYLTQREAAGLGDQKGFFEEVLEMGERELLRLLVVMLLRLGLEALLLQTGRQTPQNRPNWRT